VGPRGACEEGGHMCVYLVHLGEFYALNWVGGNGVTYLS
jgi:hypothetical protein